VDIERKYEPEMELEPKKIADLAAVVRHPGFSVIQKIARCTVDHFVLGWINAKSDAEVLDTHKKAQVAAQFYDGLIRRINDEIVNYGILVSADNQTPVDATEVLEMGESVDYSNQIGVDEEPLF
jgi:hypothetical protein